MKKLFIIDGAMRPAKNELVRHLRSLSLNLAGDSLSRISLVKKYCTKDGGEDQDYEYDPDLVSKIIGHEDEWISYHYEKETYAVRKCDLDESIAGHEYTFLIVRSTELVFELKEKYSHLTMPIKVVTVYIYSDKKEIANSYNRKYNNGHMPAISYNERRARLFRADTDYENAMALNDNYDETIIYAKHGGSGSASLAVKINALIYKYKNAIEPFSMFFIHPFHNKSQDAKRLYDELIKSAQVAFGESCKDCVSLIEGKGSYKIGDTVWKKLETSDFIVCDISSDFTCEKGRWVSSNVWLELGYSLSIMRHRNITIGNKLIITCKIIENEEFQLPTDICDLNIIFYSNFENFREQLVSHLKSLKLIKN